MVLTARSIKLRRWTLTAITLLGVCHHSSGQDTAEQAHSVQGAVEQVEVEPAAVEPAAVEPAAVEPAAVEPAAVAPTARPNIVLILADDLGFSDLASYGSEIQTPTLSALADNGVSFTNYHTAASCAPTRAMLLTGVDSHRAGVPNIPEMIPPEQRQHAHYQGVLGRNVVTVAT